MVVTRRHNSDARSLRRHLGALRRRLWLERLIDSEARALAFGFGLALVAVAAAWFTSSPQEPLYYGGPVAAAVGLGAILAAFRYPTAMETARAADHRLGLRERLGTAVELSRGDTPTTEQLTRRQLSTASEAAGWARQNWRGAPAVGRHLSLAALFGLMTAGVLLLSIVEERLPAPVPRPSIWALLPRDAPSQPATEAADEVDSQTATQRPELTNPSGRTAGVVRSLDDLRRARESGAIGASDAASRLGQAESELGRQTQESRAQREALDRLGRALDQVAAGRPAAEAIERGEYEQAAREVASLGAESDQLSPQAKAQLAQALRSAAAESPTAPELANRERRAADALAGRDYEAARRAMQDLADEVARRGRDVIPQQELARAWDRVAQERRAQGQSESQASARPRDSANSGQAGAQERGQPSSGSNTGAGAGSEPGGQGQDGAAGAGDGGDAAAPNAANAPGAPGLGEFQPEGQAARLDVQGRPVEVDVRPGDRRGQRPGDDRSDDPSANEQQTDEVGAITAVSGEAPRRITSAAPAESNFVPSDRQQVVRDYFSSGIGGVR